MDRDLDLGMDNFRHLLRFRWRADFHPERGSLLLGLMGGLVLIVVLFFLFGRGKEMKSDDLSVIKGKLVEIEERLAKLERMDKKIAGLETKVKGLEESTAKLTGSFAFGTKKRRYHEVRKGETLSRIAQKYGITLEELCRLNKITPKTIIQPGKKLLVAQ